MKFDVVGTGLVTVDLNAKVWKVPGLDQLVLMQSYRQLRGGPVATALVTLQRLGVSTAYMGELGDDDYGRFIVRGFQEEGVNVENLRITPGKTTPFSFILVDNAGRRSIIFNPGCYLEASAECINRDILKAARIFHTDAGSDAAYEACKLLKETSTKISIDAGIGFQKLERLMQFCDVLILPRGVAREVSGQKDLEMAGKKLLKKYDLELVAITSGDKGSMGITKEEIISQPAFKVDVVDTTGAGDVFNGAFLYTILQKWDLERSLKFANAVAALKCTHQTGWQGIPTLSEVKNFLKGKL